MFLLIRFPHVNVTQDRPALQSYLRRKQSGGVHQQQAHRSPRTNHRVTSLSSFRSIKPFTRRKRTIDTTQAHPHSNFLSLEGGNGAVALPFLRRRSIERCLRAPPPPLHRRRRKRRRVRVPAPSSPTPPALRPHGRASKDYLPARRRSRLQGRR
jgi:hypothetical protein